MIYEIKSVPLPVLSCKLSVGESIECKPGAMSWMTDNIRMETKFIKNRDLDGFEDLGFMARKTFIGDPGFRNRYTAEKYDGEIVFASSFPGDILSFNTEYHPVIVSKDVYLANTPRVVTESVFYDICGSGSTRSGGFCLLSFSGSGLIFLQIHGGIYEYDLLTGQSILADAGYVAAIEPTCHLETKAIKGLDNLSFGGEGLFTVKLSGPGKIWLQTMPIGSLAKDISPYFPYSQNNI